MMRLEEEAWSTSSRNMPPVVSRIDVRLGNRRISSQALELEIVRMLALAENRRWPRISTA